MYLVLVQEHVQLLHADPQVGLIELVRNVPTQWTKFPPLLDQGVEETETVQQLLEFSLLKKYSKTMPSFVNILLLSPAS